MLLDSLVERNYFVILVENIFVFIIMNKEITVYYIAKKRQLSSQSENGDEPKKQCNESTIINDVFKEGLQNPDCIAILLHCLRNLETQVNTIFTESTESKESRI